MGRTLRWMVVILTVLAAGLGGAGWYFYQQSDELLRTETIRQLKVALPEVDAKIDSARFDFSGRIRLFNMKFTPPGEDEPVLVLPELIIALDRQQLADHQLMIVKEVECVEPQLFLQRRSTGDWNFQKIILSTTGAATLPDVKITRGLVRIDLGAPGAEPIELRDVNWTARPASARQYNMQGEFQVPDQGKVSVDEALVNLDGGAYSIRGRWSDVQVGQSLWRKVGETFPEERRGLVELLDQLVEKLERPNTPSPPPVPESPTTGRGGLPTATLVSHQPDRGVASTPRVNWEQPGIELGADLRFKVASPGGRVVPKVQLLAEIRKGQITNPLLPIPLYEIAGEVYLDNSHVIVRKLGAESGGSGLEVDGAFRFDRPEGKVSATFTDVELTDRIRARMTPLLRKIIDELALSGVFDGSATLERTAEGRWQPTCTIKGRNCRFAYEKFPYPVHDTVGTVTCQPGRVDIAAEGRAGNVPLHIRGFVLNPGPAADARFELRADGVPIDRVLKENSPEAFQRVFAELALDGNADVVINLVRPPGLGQKFEPHIDAKVKNCSLTFRGFPYRITDLTGRLIADDRRFQFLDLKGKHDDATLTGFGSYDRQAVPGRLNLEIVAQNALFDQQLLKALPAKLQAVWVDLDPNGRFHVKTSIGWSPGQPVDVRIPRLEVASADVLMKEFPYPLHGVRGTFSYADNLVQIEDLRAEHDDTAVRAKGTLTLDGDSWKLHFTEFFVDDVTVTPALRRALPRSLRQVVDQLNPAGPFSIDGQVLFRRNEAVPESLGTAWKLQFVLPGNDLTAGVRLSNVHGRVDVEGRSDAESTELAGQIDFEILRALNHQVGQVKGPISLHDGELVVGSREIVRPPAVEGALPRRVSLDERISGRAIDGTLTLDALVDLRGPAPVYHMKATLARGSLERYAQLYLAGMGGLKGVMNGWIDLKGRGEDTDTITGRGQLQISPAALYSLPIFVQIFQALPMDGSKSEAFNYADLNFQIADSRFNFPSIDLVGNAISMRGRGHVRFDGAIMLDFYSMLARNQVRIPIIHEIVGAVSRGWVGVEVRGNIGAPVAKVRPVPELDGALKQFLNAFEPKAAPPPLPTFAPVR